MRALILAAIVMAATTAAARASSGVLDDDPSTEIFSIATTITGVLTANVPKTSTAAVPIRRSVSIALHYAISPVLTSGKTLTITPVYRESRSSLNSIYVPAFPTDAIVIADTDCQECIVNFVPPMGAVDVKFKVTATENATVSARAGSK